MAWRRTGNYLRLFCALVWLAASSLALAAEYRGQVTFGGLPVPGATVNATQSGKRFTAITDPQGLYSFPDLADGSWTIEVQMTGFSTIQQDVTITTITTAAPNAPVGQWQLKLLPADQIHAQIHDQIRSQIEARAKPIAPQALPAAPAPSDASQQTEASTDELSQRAADGLLINGSVNNGAASPFAQAAAFGNNRGTKGLYNGGVGMIFDNSTLDARPFSLTGLNTPKPAYNDLTGVAALGGPLRIPHLLPNGPNFFVGYQWTRNHTATTQSTVMPDMAKRGGDFSHVLNAAGQPVEIFDPATGLPFPEDMIPQMRISSQATYLLNFYPLPNFDGGTGYNYQVPIVANTHQDALQARFNQTLNPRNQIYGDFAFLSTRTSTPNVFGFLDTSDVLGINTSLNWWRRITPRLFMNPGYQFSRLRTRVAPYFENREMFRERRESRETIRTRQTGDRQASPSPAGPRDFPMRKAHSTAMRRMHGPMRCHGATTITTLPLGATSAGRSSTTWRNKTREAPLPLPARRPRDT